jgi:hypothetical protein
MVLSVFTVLGDEPCKSGCLCDAGTAKVVPDIWPNSTTALCGQPPNTCEVCSICNNNYPKCPCCNPNFADADSCLNCRLEPKNFAACGSPSVSYSCDHLEGQCVPKTAGGGAYPTKAGCAAACKATPYICKNKGQGDQCYPATQGGDFGNKTACEAVCKGPSPTPSPGGCTGSSSGLNKFSCAAWKVFAKATDITVWTACSGALLDPCSCEYTDHSGNELGVGCADGDIIAIVLAENNLKGTIPSSLGSLTKLTYLGLSGNNLKGTIPSSLGSLTKLTYLYLPHNSLTGLVPPLPFNQYSKVCILGEYGGSNHFKCPLPAGSDQCDVYCY